ncbi:cold shock domain-containing protein [Rhodopseudomonas sp. BR0C11]|uniref:cold-shock protein n=1 Tax=Rhodopseudomonas sp. BR0C11 TaxID=2269370 RepID=UPI0013DF8A22|nr:cold shock domain-containing protein [Rhodopseudomonas sp. BR0C11]
MNGTVTSFDKTKGYGFIAAEDGSRVFFHMSELRKNGIRAEPGLGEKWSFDVQHGDRGRFAANIKKVE